MKDEDTMGHKHELPAILHRQWQSIRQLTYDYLDMLEPDDLDLVLPFPASQPLRYQFRCMAGAHESYLDKLEQGSWQGFSCSLDRYDQVTPDLIRQQMQAADKRMEALLYTMTATTKLKNGESALDVVFQMIKHEMHHHGQLINLMYCHDLRIPTSWTDEWALA